MVRRQSIRGLLLQHLFWSVRRTRALDLDLQFGLVHNLVSVIGGRHRTIWILSYQTPYVD